jgi:serine protease Do
LHGFGDAVRAEEYNTVSDARDLARRIGMMAPGTTVKLSILHQGQEKTVTVTLGTLPNEKAASNEESPQRAAPDEMPKLGLTLAPSSQVAGAEAKGVVVTAVDPNGVAAFQPCGRAQAARGRPQGRQTRSVV